ncbi:MAG TPA: ComF family protein [Nevskiaceae bacterium]|nr:ComF family protein [Nevskiaceae bacterium]
MCRQTSFGGKTHSQCIRPHGLDGLTTVFAYRGVIRKAIKKLKYKFVSDLAKDLVELFLSFCGEDKVFTQVCQEKDVFFVPIPLHPTRFRWRGFNQAELLGEMIAANLKIPFLPDLLLRVKKTKPQVELKKEERKRNIRDAFALNKNSPLPLRFGGFAGQAKFLLFDDVWTSGATLKEAARVLKRNGAKKVWGLTLAR